MIGVGVHMVLLTLYVGLMGIIRNLIQKSMGMDTPLLSIFFFFIGMSRASDNSKASKTWGYSRKRNYKR